MNDIEIKLSILIPTYNRNTFVINNVSQLASFIRDNKYSSSIEIVVSDNNSNDDTYRNLIKIKNLNSDILLRIHKQERNLGLEKNATYLLSIAEGEYVMFLGDDDFIEDMYIVEIMNIIGKYDISCILPSYIAISVSNEKTGYARDIDLDSCLFERGFKNCLVNSWRGHQLSGIVLEKQGTYKSYLQNKVSNLYPFIYFVAFNCLRGNTYHLTEYPVKVTEVLQSKKDWEYDVDGLIVEIYDNYKKLKINYLLKTCLQIALLFNQKWRYMKYIYKYDFKSFITSVYRVTSGKNTLLMTRFFAPFIMSFVALRWLGMNLLLKLYKSF